MDNTAIDLKSKVLEFPVVSTDRSRIEYSRSKNYDHNRHEARNGTVDPIKDKSDIKKIADYFFNKGEYRNWCLFIVGIHTAFRASDLLRFKVSDVADQDSDGCVHIKNQILIRVKEKKTGKYRNVEIPKAAADCIAIYLEKANLKYDDWLFPSNKSSGKESMRTNGGVSIGATGKVYNHTPQAKKAGDPLDVDSFGKIMRKVQKDLKLSYNLGTHSCRKTFGYWFMQSHKNDAYALAWLQKALNHSSQAITLSYIGLSAEEDKSFYESIDYAIEY